MLPRHRAHRHQSRTANQLMIKVDIAMKMGVYSVRAERDKRLLDELIYLYMRNCI